MAPQSGAHPNGGNLKRKFNEFEKLDKELLSNKKIKPYNPQEEIEPKSVTTSQEYISWASLKQRIHKLLTEPFEAVKLKYSTDVTKNLVERIADCLLTGTAATIMVGISGDMGVGKSFLLSCLFQCGEIAKSSNNGDSCTLASNMFRAPRKGQKTPFLAEVTFFPPDVRQIVLESYLSDYHRINTGADEDDPDEEAADPEDKDHATILDEIVTALVSLFGGDPRFRTKADVRDFLDGAESENDPRLVNQLIAMCSDLIRKSTGGAQTVTVTASTPTELRAKLTDYTTQNYSEDGSVAQSLWPMVSLVSYHFDDPLTKDGIVFLDTPGLSDPSRTRRRSALQYSYQTTHKLAVIRADRARADTTVSAEVKSMNSRVEGRTTIVVTRNEEIGKDDGIPVEKAAQRPIDNLRLYLKKMEKRVSDLEEEIDDCDDDPQRKNHLRDMKSSYELRAKQAEDAERALRIRNRSGQTETTLRDKFGDASYFTTKIPVFSVSSKVYAEHLAGYSPMKAPILSVEETNIPVLRNQLRIAPNEARLHETRHMQNVIIPSLLERLSLFTSRTPVERKEDLEKHLLKPLQKHPKIIKQVFRQFERAILKTALGASSGGKVSWHAAAKSACIDWEDRNKATPFHKLMKQSGHRGGKNRVDMSASLLSLGADDISNAVARCMQTLLAFQGRLLGDIEALVDAMTTDLQEDSNSSFVLLDPFVRYVKDRKWELKKKAEASVARLENTLEYVRRKATIAYDDAYFVVAMSPIYAQVNKLKAEKIEKGAPKPARKPKTYWTSLRKTTFRDEVTSVKGPWASIATGMAEDIKKSISEEITILLTDLGRIFGDFHQTFNELCESKDEDNPNEVKLQRELSKNLKTAQGILENEMQGYYETLYRDFH